MSTPHEAVTSISLQELARRLDLEPPATDLEITGVNTIEDAGPSELTFLANDRYAVKLKDSKAGAVIVASDFEGEVPMAALRCAKPRLAFAKTLQLFHPPARPTPGVHPTAIVPESCTLGEDVSIGAYVVLGERVQLGDRVALHPHTVVYDDVAIGADSVIHSHVSLREGIRLGRNVVIQNGAMLGPDGFGFEVCANAIPVNRAAVAARRRRCAGPRSSGARPRATSRRSEKSCRGFVMAPSGKRGGVNPTRASGETRMRTM